MSTHRSRSTGFSLIELMVVIAIIGIGLALGMPYMGGVSKAAKERGMIARMQQDFAWARTAAGAADASVLVSGASGIPDIRITLGADCGWSTKVNGVADPLHTTAAVAGVTCPTDAANTLTLPVTFKFTTQGTMDTSGTFRYLSTSGTAWPLIFLTSGTVLLNANSTLS